MQGRLLVQPPADRKLPENNLKSPDVRLGRPAGVSYSGHPLALVGKGRARF